MQYPNRITGKPGMGGHYIKKKAAYKDTWEPEWKRVERRRKEGKCLGGKYRPWERTIDMAYFSR